MYVVRVLTHFLLDHNAQKISEKPEGNARNITIMFFPTCSFCENRLALNYSNHRVHVPFKNVI